MPCCSAFALGLSGHLGCLRAKSWTHSFDIWVFSITVVLPRSTWSASFSCAWERSPTMTRNVQLLLHSRIWSKPHYRTGLRSSVQPFIKSFPHMRFKVRLLVIYVHIPASHSSCLLLRCSSTAAAASARASSFLRRASLCASAASYTIRMVELIT